MKRMFILASIFMLAACSTEYEQPLEEVKSVSKNSFKVSEEEAIKRLEKLLNVFEPTTRGDKRSVKNVIAYRSKKTRSSSSDTPDTLMYILNFDDNDGYAVLSADARFPYILALVDTGNYQSRSYPSAEFDQNLINNLDPDETDDFWCSQYYDSIPYITMIEDFLYQAPYQLTDTITELKTQVGPFTNTRWGQSDPYNRLCDGSSSNIGSPAHSNYPTGCVAVALSQIMAYHKYPSSAYGHTYDWNKITSTSKITANSAVDQIYEVAHLMRACGIAAKTNYNTNGSWSTANRAKKSFKRCFRLLRHR